MKDAITTQSAELLAVIERTQKRLASDNLVALGVVTVDARGFAATAFAGHNDGHFWDLLAGAADLLSRIHKQG
jgi:hypothetical protein